MGTIINQRKTWDSKYIQTLANDLKQYDNGYSTQNLKYMSKLAKEFSKEEFSQQLADHLIPWSSIITIMQKFKYMSQFAKEFSKSEIRHQPGAQIPWRTIMTVILPKFKSHYEMLFYINSTYKNGWSRSMILNQIAMKSYERSLIEA